MRRSLLTALLLAASLAAPLDVMACGGCFSPPGQQNNQLVLQNAERVLFHQDPTTKKSLVWVEVRYTGLAKDFGWVLPLPSKPKVSVGSSWVFDQLDQRHAPRFSTSTESGDENCRSWTSYCFGTNPGGGGRQSAAADAGSSGGPNSPAAEDSDGKSGVTVLEKDQAGPYDYEILASKDPAALLKWLNDHGYATPQKALPIIKTHLDKGDVFVAVKLQNGSGVNEVKPIVLEMDGAESCVPLRLTSIAATDNMSVVVTLGGPGRAIPKNHMHVQINPMKLNWFSNGSNYAQIMAEAIDEAAGHAFVTEYASDAKGTQLIGKNNRMDAAPFSLVTDAAGLGAAILKSRLILTGDSVSILEKFTGLAKLAGQTPQSYYSLLRNCGNARNSSWCSKQLAGPSTLPVDGPKLGAALKKDFIDPIHTVSDRLGSAARITRLVMRISPEEMDRDPIFGFNTELPNVSNEYKASFKRVCSTGWYPYDKTRLTIAGMGSYVFDGVIPNDFSSTGKVGNNAIDKRFIDSPMALRVELLDENGPAKPVADAQIELVDTAIAGATVGTKSLPSNLILTPVEERWTLPKDDDKRIFVKKRDDSKCTVVHVVKPWGTAADDAHPTDAAGGVSAGGCTASQTSTGSTAAGLVFLLLFGAVLFRRRLA
ncbi:MAG: DUF2330 domain-containing protein [Myxococcales bacterium]|nr:DUF2330 domain-containing protein [Myxococcales bacterium]